MYSKRFGPVAHHVDVVGDVLPLERVQRQHFVVRVVFDQQDFDAVVSPWKSSSMRA